MRGVAGQHSVLSLQFDLPEKNVGYLVGSWHIFIIQDCCGLLIIIDIRKVCN